jgi:hypothetical protein
VGFQDTLSQARDAREAEYNEQLAAQQAERDFQAGDY